LLISDYIPYLDALGEFQSSSPVPLRPYRTRSASVNSDRYSVSEVGGDSKSTPQLLGTMGELISQQQKSLFLSFFLSQLYIELKNLFVIDSGSFPAAESNYARPLESQTT